MESSPSRETSLALGKPAAGVDVKLIDDRGGEVKVGEIGEIITCSPKMMSGYWQSGSEENSRATFVSGREDRRWLKTGDLAYRDSDCVFWFAGRKKDTIVLPTGDTISPAEIENYILAIPSVEACIVAGVPSDTNMDSEIAPEESHAFIVSNIPYSQQQLLQFLESRTSRYKLPRKVHFLTEIPRGVSRKVSRRLLLNWLRERDPDSSPHER